MLTILFTMCLIGQEPPTQAPVEEETPVTELSKPEELIPTTTAINRTAVMKLLQGTYYGSLLDENKLSVYGWTQLAYTGATNSGNLFPYAMNFEGNRFIMPQNYLRFERTVDQSSTTPTWGFRSDTILPGTDYRFTVARNLFDKQLTAENGQPNYYGIDPVQFYGEAYIPTIAHGMDIKVGRFFTQFGAESIDATQNLFLSHSYLFEYDPFTHTGILTTTKLDDTWSVQNGLVLGNDNFIGPTDSPYYLGSVKWAPPTGATSVLLSTILGKGRYDSAHQFHNPNLVDLIVTQKLNDRLNYTLDALYGYTTQVPNIGFANWYSAVQYLSYRVNSELLANLRVEVFDDVQGMRTGFAGLYTETSIGLNYQPAPYLRIRPELRYDHNDSRPFQGKPDLFTAAVDMIIFW